MAYEHEKEMIEQIVEKTKAGSLIWKIQGSDENLMTKIDDYFIVLEETRNANGSDLYVVRLLNQNGGLVDTFHDENLDNERGNKFFTMLKSLTAMATRNARGTDQAVSSILNRLKNM